MSYSNLLAAAIAKVYFQGKDEMEHYIFAKMEYIQPNQFTWAYLVLHDLKHFVIDSPQANKMPSASLLFSDVEVCFFSSAFYFHFTYLYCDDDGSRISVLCKISTTDGSAKFTLLSGDNISKTVPLIMSNTLFDGFGKSEIHFASRIETYIQLFVVMSATLSSSFTRAASLMVNEFSLTREWISIKRADLLIRLAIRTNGDTVSFRYLVIDEKTEHSNYLDISIVESYSSCPTGDGPFVRKLYVTYVIEEGGDSYDGKFTVDPNDLPYLDTVHPEFVINMLLDTTEDRLLQNKDSFVPVFRHLYIYSKVINYLNKYAMPVITYNE